MSTRAFPNIIITGTPGCGKTSHAESLVGQLNESNYHHYCISDLAKQRKWVEGYDEKLDTSIVDEDKLLDSMESDLEKGGAIVDWHVCEIFPERLIDLVVVLRTDNSLLHDRLTKRGYKDNKIQENLDCEIMEIILQEAKESYVPEIVVVLNSNSGEEMDENVDRILQWIKNWEKDHPDGVTNELDPSKLDQEESNEESDSE